MNKPTVWNMYASDGSYIGQTEANTKELAFARCMFVKGVQVVASGVEGDSSGNSPGRVVYQTEEYFLSPLGYSGE